MNYRAMRQAAGLTQAEIAFRVGCSRGYYSAIETGRVQPSARLRAELLCQLTVMSQQEGQIGEETIQLAWLDIMGALECLGDAEISLQWAIRTAPTRPMVAALTKIAAAVRATERVLG
jgi:transcriptional regulator with XRE-family HTH domain